MWNNVDLRIAVFTALSFIWISSCTGSISLTPTGLPPKNTGDDVIVTCQSDVVQENPSWFKVANDGEAEIGTSGRVASRLSTGIPNRSTLVINNATLDDAGEYKCKAGSSSGSIMLKLHKKISFVDTPTEQHPIEGDTAVIRCRADGEPTPIISWMRKRTGTIPETIPENNGRYEKSENGDLKIPEYRIEHDDGTYVCEAIQLSMGTMKSVEIKVTGHVPPSPAQVALIGIDKRADGVVNEGTTATLTCSSNGVPPPEFTWYKDEVQVPHDDGRFKMAQAGYLQIAPVKREDDARYRCIAKNAAGEQSDEIPLRVFKKPLIERIRPGQVMQNGSINFECIFDGSEPMYPVWTGLGEVIPVRPSSVAEEETETTTPKLPDKYVEIMDGKAILHLRNIHLSDAIEYQCTVTNDAGSAIESANLTVMAKPTVVARTTSVRGILNMEYTLVCDVSAVPAATWAWYKSGQKLDVDGIGSKITDEHHGKNGHVSKLAITLVAESDFGFYECRANNELGEDGRRIEIIKIQPPLRPDPVCGDRKPTMIVLNISQFSTSQPESYWPIKVHVVVRTSNNVVHTPEFSQAIPRGVYKIPQLEPSTKYEFTITGTNEAGTSPSNIIDCSTTDPAPPSKPEFSTTPIRCNYTKDCAVEWLLEENGGKDIKWYRLQLRQDGEPVEPKEIRINGDVRSYVLSDLKPQTTYKLTVSAYNDEGWSDPAETELITYDADTQKPEEIFAAHGGPSTGTIVAIVVVVVLLVVVIVDVACYYANECGLLMCICVNMCGKKSPDEKSKEGMMEQPAKETRFEEPVKQVKSEQVVLVTERETDGTSESTPMIGGSQNGYPEKRGKDTQV